MILDGKKYSLELRDLLKDRVENLKKKNQKEIGLAIILVGDDPASQIYVRNKIKTAKYIGINAKLINITTKITQDYLINVIKDLNQDQSIHGIIVQLPLPKGLNEQLIIDTIDPNKDVDGFGVINRGRLFSSLPALYPATPAGIIKLLDKYQIKIESKHVVVIGRSNIVGKPMSMLLLNRNATVTIAHSKTVDLSSLTKQADILIVAVGKSGFITSDMIKNQAVIIDVGINRIQGKILGDVDFENVAKIASAITPVPGGVGPLTIITLLENTVDAYEKQEMNRK